jgi:hypothetical protein
LTPPAAALDRLVVSLVSRGSGALLLAALAHAPFQCAHDLPPDRHNEDDAAEAVYVLAEQLHVKGDERGRKDALEFLVQRYPSSRYAVRAREDLGQPIDPPEPPKLAKP